MQTCRIQSLYITFRSPWTSEERVEVISIDTANGKSEGVAIDEYRKTHSLQDWGIVKVVKP